MHLATSIRRDVGCAMTISVPLDSVPLGHPNLQRSSKANGPLRTETNWNQTPPGDNPPRATVQNTSFFLRPQFLQPASQVLERVNSGWSTSPALDAGGGGSRAACDGHIGAGAGAHAGARSAGGAAAAGRSGHARRDLKMLFRRCLHRAECVQAGTRIEHANSYRPQPRRSRAARHCGSAHLHSSQRAAPLKQRRQAARLDAPP